MYDKLRNEFEAGENSFLITLRCELKWDWDAFYKCTSLMYEVAMLENQKPAIDMWIAQGFWSMDTWVKEWSSNENFPRPQPEKYKQALMILNELAYLLFNGESPYMDNTLEKLAKNDV
ncbi:hypothetical protein L1077_26930 [Pseudoalteromonas luteoviolacea]|uniref:hypothetical protein n=1 Tax=Pseudoalteromonas luteoviolacea TaxID=43657 RepID=UPI001F43AC46|nr:hypothetical protein [Pseudoalteromonas luteoviolacea]MCF6443065.1 hypothetical protein [Pseudoalteromonas luteoviolacea]